MVGKNSVTFDKKYFSNFIYFITLVFVLVILDQISKYFAFQLTQKIVLIPGFLWLSFTQNTGAAFGMFKGFQFVLGIINLVVAAVVFYLYYKGKLDFYLPFALIIGGAIGNAIDRFFYAGVIDFLYLGWWPTFNLADSFIFCGVILFLVLEFRKSIKEKKDKAK
jgi:signal peptidase II